ncbi:MAG: hypothetical protein EOM16_03935 [Bacteroidia bacterium]|nr:hypothetical protein [Bacteroidia bacterium]
MTSLNTFEMKERLRKILDIECGLRYMYSTLELSSSFSQKILLEKPIMTSASEIEKYYNGIYEVVELLTANNHFKEISGKLNIYLAHLKDIRNSMIRISEGTIADDIELFEIKSLVNINQKIQDLLSGFGIKAISLPELDDLQRKLDPDNTGVNSFYIYDSYDCELARLRAEIKSEPIYNDELNYRCSLIEHRIRKELSQFIKERYELLKQSYENLTSLDILIGKSNQILSGGLTIPKISQEVMVINGMFNPEVSAILMKEGKEYQKTQITLEQGVPTLVTGSNMGGKSLTIKTLALCQYLFQFGFGIPADSALLFPVQEILISTGDQEDYKKGLSSFAAEMVHIDKVIKKIKSGIVCLTLIDEPARTTNPTEGAALASALLKILSKSKGFSVMTSHYTIANTNCNRVRVLGFTNGTMDYSLIPDDGIDTPAEAINIAESLSIDQEWIQIAKQEITNTNI